MAAIDDDFVASKFTSFDTGNLNLDLSNATKTHSNHNNAYHVIWVVLFISNSPDL